MPNNTMTKAAAPMGVRVQVYALAADAVGVWKIGGTEPWDSGLVTAGQGTHGAVEQLLAERDVTAKTAVMLHSTSWHDETDAAGLHPSVMHTYAVVLECDGLALDVYAHLDPRAVNPPALIDAYGSPADHEPDEAPEVDDLDVALHAVRHLAFLALTNPKQRQAFNEHWLRWLGKFLPALARLYKPAERKTA